MGISTIQWVYVLSHVYQIILYNKYHIWIYMVLNINFYQFFIEFHTVGWGLLIVPIIEQPLGGSSSPPSRPSRTMMQGLMAFNEPRLGHGTSEKRTLKAKQHNRTLQRYIHIESY